jgi:Ca2+-binding EF-hand superfamily protein
MSTTARRLTAAALCILGASVVSVAAMAGGGSDCPQSQGARVDLEGGDGQLSASEHAAGAQKRFETMDVDKNGKLTGTEIDASHGAESVAWANHRISSAGKIKKLDTDNDGALTATEYADGSQKMFRKLDTDSDGYLTAAEMHVDSNKRMSANGTD